MFANLMHMVFPDLGTHRVNSQEAVKENGVNIVYFFFVNRRRATAKNAALTYFRLFACNKDLGKPWFSRHKSASEMVFSASRFTTEDDGEFLSQEYFAQETRMWS